MLDAAVAGRELYEDVTSHPAIAEDIAVIADRDVPAQTDPRDDRRRPAASCCGRSSVFDVYEGEQVPEGKRSLALRLEFRAPDRTLTDAEVAEVRSEVVAALASIGAELRG